MPYRRKNALFVVAAEDIRAALAKLASAGADIQSFAADSNGAVITLHRPINKRVIANAEAVGVEVGPLGKHTRYRGYIHHVAIEWLD
jgi:hypothetical protein